MVKVFFILSYCTLNLIHSCVAFGSSNWDRVGSMDHSPIKQKNITLTTEIAINEKLKLAHIKI